MTLRSAGAMRYGGHGQPSWPQWVEAPNWPSLRPNHANICMRLEVSAVSCCPRCFFPLAQTPRSSCKGRIKSPLGSNSSYPCRHLGHVQYSFMCRCSFPKETSKSRSRQLKVGQRINQMNPCCRRKYAQNDSSLIWNVYLIAVNSVLWWLPWSLHLSILFFSHFDAVFSRLQLHLARKSSELWTIPSCDHLPWRVPLPCLFFGPQRMSKI